MRHVPAPPAVLGEGAHRGALDWAAAMACPFVAAPQGGPHSDRTVTVHKLATAFLLSDPGTTPGGFTTLVAGFSLLVGKERDEQLQTGPQ